VSAEWGNAIARRHLQYMLSTPKPRFLLCPSPETTRKLSSRSTSQPNNPNSLVLGLVSGGATGFSISEHDAYKAISEKNRFVPDEGRNIISTFLSPRYGSYWNLEQPMYYRQCMLFVVFMRDYDEKAFQKFLVALERGDNFRNAIFDAYHIRLSSLWETFVEKSIRMASPKTSEFGLFG